MPDMPKIKRSRVIPAMREAVTAGEAVRSDIATHVEKHRKAMQDAHHKLKLDNALSAKSMKSG
jgi:hypothetical protein